MAYMSQERKKELAPAIMSICKEYGIKATLGVDNPSTLYLSIKSGPLDFISNFNEDIRKNPEFGILAKSYIDVNTYHIDKHFTDTCREFLLRVKEAMMEGNHNNSDIMTDYFDVGWYIDISVGRWDKPYQLVEV